MYTHADKKEVEPVLTEYNEIEHVRKIPNTQAHTKYLNLREHLVLEALNLSYIIVGKI